MNPFRRRFRLALLILIAFGAGAPFAQAQRKLLPGQVARLTTINRDGSDLRVLFETTSLIEAPNWMPNGRWLIYNSGGAMWRIAADGSGKPVKIYTGTAQSANNDHVLSPDGKTMYIGSTGHLFAVPIEGGEARKISNDHPPAMKYRYYLHGISPDGKTLAYVGAEALPDGKQQLDLYTIPSSGGPDRRLTTTAAPDDGPEYSPDGKWIYFNSELNGRVPGDSQIYRMRPDATGIEQLTRDERVNWFPHISPDGKWVVYISFPPGTEKHPANKDVILRRMRADGSEQTDLVSFFGGQGTINVNSWAPDSRHFAFVSYPIATPSVTK